MNPPLHRRCPQGFQLAWLEPWANREKGCADFDWWGSCSVELRGIEVFGTFFLPAVSRWKNECLWRGLFLASMTSPLFRDDLWAEQNFLTWGWTSKIQQQLLRGYILLHKNTRTSSLPSFPTMIFFKSKLKHIFIKNICIWNNTIIQTPWSFLSLPPFWAQPLPLHLLLLDVPQPKSPSPR